MSEIVIPIFEHEVDIPTRIGIDGKNAFELWLEIEGNENKTFQEWLDYLQQPATEAANEIGELEEQVRLAELDRIDQEIIREGNEDIRKQNEIDRGLAEGDREIVKQAMIDERLVSEELNDHPNIIQNGTWWKWSTETKQYVDSGQAATPYEHYLQNTADSPVLTEAEWSVWSKEQGDYALEQGDYAKAQGDHALAQGDYAKTQGDYAKAQGDYANEQGDYALSQGDYAKAQGDYANALFDELELTISEGNEAVDVLEGKATLADEATLAANNAANLANEKAGLANDAAILANEKAGLANDAADLANNKANLANTKATLAQEAADLANEIATHPPVIQSGTWYYWNASTNAYVDTNISATPYENYLQNTTDNPPLTETQWSVWSKEQGNYAKAQGDYAKNVGDTYDTVKVSKTALEATEEVTAQSLVELKERVDALEEFIKQGLLNNILINNLSVENLQINGASLILSGTTAPAVVPDFIGQFFIKTTATTACYQATGIAEVGDWKLIG